MGRYFQLGEKAQEALRQVLADHPRVHTAPGQLPEELQGLLDDLRPPRELVRIVGWPEGEPPGSSDPGLTEGEATSLAELERALELTKGARARKSMKEAIAEFQQKRDGTWDPEEYPQRAGLQCPYCEAIHWDGAEEGIRVVDVAERWSSFGYRDEEKTIHGDYDGDADFEGDRYECEACGHEVALPEGIEEDGW